MEAKYWFYIIVGGIYLLSRFLKKSDNPAEKTSGAPAPRPAPSQNTEQSKPKTLTFEELLREITEAKETARHTTPAPQPRPQAKQFTEVDYDDDLKQETEDLEEIVPDYRSKDKSYEAYEEGKRSAFNRPSLEETLNVRNTDMKYGKFKVFEQEQQRNLLEEYTRQLQDPEGLKKAVVMSEILSRKF